MHNVQTTVLSSESQELLASGKPRASRAPLRDTTSGHEPHAEAASAKKRAWPSRLTWLGLGRGLGLGLGLGLGSGLGLGLGLGLANLLPLALTLNLALARALTLTLGSQAHGGELRVERAEGDVGGGLQVAAQRGGEPPRAHVVHVGLLVGVCAA